MALTSLGFTSLFGGASSADDPGGWPGSPMEGDHFICATIGSPADTSAMNAMEVTGADWQTAARVLVSNGTDRPFALCVDWCRYQAGDTDPGVNTHGGWTSSGWRWSARIGGYRGALADPDLVNVDSEVVPTTPFLAPMVNPNRDTGLITIVAQAADDSDMSVLDPGDFTQPTNVGVTDGTGGARWALWFHDLEAYAPPAPDPQWPEVNVRDTAIPTARAHLAAVTLNLPIALFPPEGRGPYLGFRR